MQMKKSSSYYYWKAREQAQDQLYKAEEERYLQYINKQYDRAMDQIQKEIDSFYAKYATSEGISISEAKRRVSKLDIEEYSRKAEKYVKDKNFTKKANEEMRLYNATMRINRLEMLKANIGLETVSAQSDTEKYLDEILKGRTREEIKHQSGILGQSANTNTDKAIAAIVNGSFRNSKYAAKWSDTLWKNQTLLKSELDRLLTKGLTQGKSSRALASELRKSINAEKSVAERLMRTELARVTIESGLSLMEENEYDEYIYMTLSFKDGKICDDCKALDGKHFKRKDAEVGFNLPPMHPNCRCSIAPYEVVEPYNRTSDSGIIKSLDMGDFAALSSIHGLAEDKMNVIKDVITEYEKKGGMYISEVKFGQFFDEETGNEALMQIDLNHYDQVVLNINKVYMAQFATLEELNKKIKSLKSTLANDLREATIHECGHAKAYYRKSRAEITRMNEAIKDKGCSGISGQALDDGAETIAEVEVLLSRGEPVPKEALELYKTYIK